MCFCWIQALHCSYGLEREPAWQRGKMPWATHMYVNLCQNLVDITLICCCCSAVRNLAITWPWSLVFCVQYVRRLKHLNQFLMTVWTHICLSITHCDNLPFNRWSYLLVIHWKVLTLKFVAGLSYCFDMVSDLHHCTFSCSRAWKVQTRKTRCNILALFALSPFYHNNPLTRQCFGLLTFHILACKETANTHMQIYY